MTHVKLKTESVNAELVLSVLKAYLHHANPSALIKLVARAMTEVAFVFSCEDKHGDADVLLSVSHELFDAELRARDIEDLERKCPSK